MAFPKGFLFGAATAGHQVEGQNIHSDCWAQEQMPHSIFTEPSGEACDHYHRYEEDIRLAKSAGLNAYRFSIEWARVEPEEGCFCEEEIEHYRRMIRFCREVGMEPVVTLHHFSSPVWVIRKGGFGSRVCSDAFFRYATHVVDALHEELHYVCTFNEINMGKQLESIMKRFEMVIEAARKQAAMSEGMSRARAEEGKAQVGMDFGKMLENQRYAAEENEAVFGTPNPKMFVSAKSPEEDLEIVRCHTRVRKAIKEKYPELKVGFTLSLHDVQALPGGEAAAEAQWEEEFGHYLPYMEEDDFFGVQNYTRMRFDENGQMNPPEGAALTQMDYEFYPEGLEHVIRKVAERFHGEILVTENGIATANDEERVRYIETALHGVERAVSEGISVKGYFYWSLLDNFEWQKGFSMTFGLIAVDRETQERRPKESLAFLGTLAKRAQEGVL